MSDRVESTDCLIRGYRLELAEIPCLPGVAAWNARALLEDDIGAALPYLNSELRGAEYHRDLDTLIWRSGSRKYAFRSREIAVAPVADREEAQRLMTEAVGIVEGIWSRRGEIVPSFSRRRPPGVMDIYKLLPRTNCGKCGYPSCMAYAAQLREGKAEWSQCPDIAGHPRTLSLIEGS